MIVSYLQGLGDDLGSPESDMLSQYHIEPLEGLYNAMWDPLNAIWCYIGLNNQGKLDYHG